MRNSVIIVIPIYKCKLNVYENIALQQLKKVLYKYPKIFVTSSSLKFDYGDDYKEWPVERFPDEFFCSTTSYSRLCLSESFYERFLSYKYILFYQTDAFVFSDRLEEFCAMGYDYIGAPAPKSAWRFLRGQVGNGGFSLRKVDSILRMLKNKEKIMERAAREYTQEFLSERLSIEDQFFGYCSSIKEFGFSVPSLKMANEFSIECNVGKAYRGLSFKLPFGCHRWYNNSFSIWKPIIQRYGYAFEITKADNFHDGDELRRIHIGGYLLERFLRNHGRETSYSVWGYGDIGHKCVAFLRKGGYPISVIYDTRADALMSKDGIPIRQPMDVELIQRKSYIIIATNIYGIEIERRLLQLSLKKNLDFIRFFDVKNYSVCGCRR